MEFLFGKFWKIITGFCQLGELTNNPQLLQRPHLSAIKLHAQTVTETCKLHIHPVKSKQTKVLNQSLL